MDSELTTCGKCGKVLNWIEPCDLCGYALGDEDDDKKDEG